ncbi:hypothetical protein [Asticcacaulis taihuensis]|uniref:hypothetical protein n=1 Tax=Asticcacaulis taihuensis TaxID=260084 RepID=UPI003F7CA595
MDTLHKKLSEIRDLRTEELDLVGGADEGHITTVMQVPHVTWSVDSLGHQIYDDGTVEVFYDNN